MGRILTGDKPGRPKKDNSGKSRKFFFNFLGEKEVELFYLCYQEALKKKIPIKIIFLDALSEYFYKKKRIYSKAYHREQAIRKPIERPIKNDLSK